MMDEERRPGWPMVGGIAAVAVIAGFGISHLFTDKAAPAPAPAVEAAPAVAGPALLKIPAAYVQSANIGIEPVAAGGVAAMITAPATIVASPQGEAIVVARAAGTITRITHRLGDSVRAGEPLAWVDSADAATMSADRSVAAAKADLARKAFAREDALYRQGVTPRQDMEAAQAALAVADAEARRAAAVVQAAHVAGQAAAVVSPISGRITAASATLGAFVAPQVELFHVAGTGAAQIEASVTGEDARRIRPGDPATILLTSGAPVAASVRAITPTVSGGSRSATVVLAPSAGAAALVVGEGVQVRIQARSAEGGTGLSVPEEAVQSIDGRDMLFVRTPEGFRPVPVLVGARTGGVAQILSGIAAGTPIAARNAFLLKAELKKGADEDEE